MSLARDDLEISADSTESESSDEELFDSSPPSLTTGHCRPPFDEDAETARAMRRWREMLGGQCSPPRPYAWRWDTPIKVETPEPVDKDDNASIDSRTDQEMAEAHRLRTNFPRTWPMRSDCLGGETAGPGAMPNAWPRRSAMDEHDASSQAGSSTYSYLRDSQPDGSRTEALGIKPLPIEMWEAAVLGGPGSKAWTDACHWNFIDVEAVPPPWILCPDFGRTQLWTGRAIRAVNRAGRSWMLDAWDRRTSMQSDLDQRLNAEYEVRVGPQRGSKRKRVEVTDPSQRDFNRRMNRR